MKFIVEDRIFENIPDLYIGVVAVKGVDNSKSYPQIEAMLDESIAAAQQKFDGVKVKTSPDIVPYREAFRTLGLNPNRFPCSVEAMFNRISKGKGMPHINPLVDLNNALSLKYTIPMGTHDLGRSPVDMEMRYAREGDHFLPFGETEEEAPGEDEVVYAVGHEVRTRRWTWRQSEHGKITADMSYVFFPIDGFVDFNKDRVDAVIAELSDILKNVFGCPVVSGVVTKDHPSIDVTL